MLASEFVSAVTLKATGKLPTFTSGSTKWLKILAIGNQYIDTWQEEYGVDWGSLYLPAQSFGTVTATDSFAIPPTVRKLSDRDGDSIRILHTGGVRYSDYALVTPDELKGYYSGQTKQYGYGKYAAQIGSNLVFNHTFATTDPQFGGTISVPCYKFAPHITADADVVPVDIPQWLVVISAAEYVRNDVTRAGQYPNLINEANSLMQRMRENNDAQVDDVIRTWNPVRTQTAFGPDW